MEGVNVLEHMNTKQLYIGETNIKNVEKIASGCYVNMEGEAFYKISAVDSIRPFFMSIVSDSNHWMFLSSNGALTAGRISPEHAIFPYYTVDKIHDSKEITGSKTIVHVKRGNRTFLWEPFSDRYQGIYSINRNIFKNIPGNKVVFEEINQDLGVAFRYMWSNSDRFGFLKRSNMENLLEESCSIEILDGIQNILPSGVNIDMQHTKSVLVDAYRKSELTKNGIGIFVLSSIPVDRAEPSEALRATTVWSIGDHIRGRLLSSIQLDAFRMGKEIHYESDIRAHRGAYFLHIQQTLQKNEPQVWYIVIEADQSSAKVADLELYLHKTSGISNEIENELVIGTQKLIRLVGNADGIQVSRDRLSAHRHLENVLFNTMRGGIFADGYQIQRVDFEKFLSKMNKSTFEKHKAYLKELPDHISYADLKTQVAQIKDASFTRAVMEYLPLTFSRRHGDPSCPWNSFSIATRDEEGKQVLNYQGNWRDIFQNWEALCLSYPEYIESILHKFVNATTCEGYNSYRVTRDGFDWEVHDPNDPWSNIGYWGDHQVIYLLRFLELEKEFFPGLLEENLLKDLFVFAHVPYRIKSYQDMLSDLHHTIVYDTDMESAIQETHSKTGSDGKLHHIGKEVYYVNLTEKLILVLLGKLVNFIPDGGIWMNTQRPEWNDANNALVGNGLSMVTLYYMRRYVHFCLELFRNISFTEVPISEEVAVLLNAVQKTLSYGEEYLQKGFDDISRKDFTDRLGTAAFTGIKFTRNGFSGKRVFVLSSQFLKIFRKNVVLSGQISIHRNRIGRFLVPCL